MNLKEGVRMEKRTLRRIGLGLALAAVGGTTVAVTTAVAHKQAGIKVIGEAEGHHVFVVAGPKSNPELEPIAKSLPALLQMADAGNAQKARAPHGGFAPPIR